MPDITMCSGKNCEIKNECYRYRAIPNEFRQSWFADNDLYKYGSCDFFTSVKGWPDSYLREVEELDK